MQRQEIIQEELYGKERNEWRIIKDYKDQDHTQQLAKNVNEFS